MSRAPLLAGLVSLTAALVFAPVAHATDTREAAEATPAPTPAGTPEADPTPDPAPAATPALAPSAESPDEHYRRAVGLYERGEYAIAAAEFQRLLYPPKPGMDPEKTRRAHLYRGISLYLLDDKASADGEFWAVLLSDPDYAPDPLFTPPAVIASFGRLKRDNAAELRKVRVTRRREELPRDPLGIPLEPARTSGTGGIGKFWWSIAPFGAAQFHNGQPRKAYTLLAIEVPLLAANLSSLAAFEALKQEDGRFDREDLPRARFAKNVNNASFALLVAALLYGSADGLWHGSLRAAPLPEKPGPRIAPGPGSAGLSVEFRF